MKAKEEISARQIGRNLLVIIDKVKYTKVTTDNKQVARIKNKILLFNKRNSKALKEEILDIFIPSRIEKEKLKATEKGLKKAIKKVAKGAKKEVVKKKVQTKKLLTKIKSTDKPKIRKKDLELLVTSNSGGIALKGFENIDMPELLIKRIQDFINAGQSIEALINFWMLCLLNPNEIARTKLFDYIERQNLTITPSGYLVTFRMVKSTTTSNLDKTYYDAHTGKFAHILNKVSKMDRADCDEDGSRDCSKGLHVGTPKFIGIITDKKIEYKEGVETVGDNYGIKYVTTKENHPNSYGTNYNSPKEVVKQFDNTFGNQAIMCYVNPAHVVSVPESDTRKMRCCEFYFAKLVTAEEVIDMVEKDYLLYDDDYNKIEREHLKELLKDKVLKNYINAKDEISTRVKNLKAQLDIYKEKLKLSSDNINTMLSLNELKQIIQKRQIIIAK